MTAALGLSAVALLERFFPYDKRWQGSDVDLPADIVHAIVNLMVMHAAVLAFVWLRGASGWQGIWWPSDWPFIAQVFLAGMPLDVSLYAVHRQSIATSFCGICTAFTIHRDVCTGSMASDAIHCTRR